MKLIILVLGVCVVPFFAALAQPSLTQMEDGDRVDVYYHSTGCFHSVHDLFRFDRQNGVTAVSLYQIQYDKDGASTLHEVKCEQTLLNKVVRELDVSLLSYREHTPLIETSHAEGKEVRIKRAGMYISTTHTTLTFKYIEQGKLICEEIIENPVSPQKRLQADDLLKQLKGQLSAQ